MADFFESDYLIVQLCRDIKDQRRVVSAEAVVKVLRDVPSDYRQKNKCCEGVLRDSAMAERKDLIRAIVKTFNWDVETMSRGLFRGILYAPGVNMDMLKFAVHEMGSKVDIKIFDDSPVTFAIRSNNFDLLKALVEDFKADVNFGNEVNDFPLKVAIENDWE